MKKTPATITAIGSLLTLGVAAFATPAFAADKGGMEKVLWRVQGRQERLRGPGPCLRRSIEDGCERQGLHHRAEGHLRQAGRRQPERQVSRTGT